MPAIVIIADDLSGAAELAGIAFAHGLSAEVQRQFDPATSTEVIAVDTDSRLLTPEAAAKRVAEVTCAIVASRPHWIFKKTDSVLRGHPAAEITAAMSAVQVERSLFVPANPSRGRTILGGVYSIHGVPLESTAFASDPEFPRRWSRVADLLGTAPNIAVPDVADVATLSVLARSLDSRTLPAGAADFFTAVLAERTGRRELTPANHGALNLAPPRLLVCGSKVSWSVRRAACVAAGIPAIDLGSLPDLRAALAIGIGEQVPPNISPGELLEQLTLLAANLLYREKFATVLAEGGATAAALAERMSWTRFRVAASAPAGVGVLQPLAAAAQPILLIKPGSYDWPESIWREFAGNED